jgi:predicted lipid-binding transport protein (Tim44 family)
MSGGYQYLDIILFALVAAFLILRLRNVLGRRDGHQGPPNDPFGTPSKPDKPKEKVVRLPDRGDQTPEAAEEPVEAPVEAPAGEVRTPLEAGLTQIKVADPKFDSTEFLSGARIAFEMILTSYSAGDSATLKPLLSPEVFGNFSQSISDRQQANETTEITLVGFKSADIVEAYMAGRTAHLTIKFISQQITAVRNEDNVVIEGDPKEVIEVTDFWTFARDTRSGDPNWILVATGSLD